MLTPLQPHVIAASDCFIFVKSNIIALSGTQRSLADLVKNLEADIRASKGLLDPCRLHAEGGVGSLAIFCPTCPQPGINLPENWKSDSNQSVPSVVQLLHQVDSYSQEGIYAEFDG